ncbi:divalent-cation tolerance protein CutA [Acidiferrobacter sp. SPIII_3]|uniref:divalent-cation tolerance protein CutA n=1 Tax=Acidiferrobacter sp. SPIII_3 TaxID=1281578 RepID=UPI000D739695|nr:divalent-cation tolerance protein CutA [Acidiferrobacter sp. SPIII_3]AWP22022.1 divalent-cation tolerance protein CutA [Acidiferrobacter sp. SPIII_3]
MPQEALIVFSTCPRADAPGIASALVNERLAACVNLLDAVQSVYRWRGQVETATETLLIIKTTTDHYDEMERRLRALHPYEVPEIVAVPVARGYPAYRQWLEDATRP